MDPRHPFGSSSKRDEQEDDEPISGSSGPQPHQLDPNLDLGSSSAGPPADPSSFGLHPLHQQGLQPPPNPRASLDLWQSRNMMATPRISNPLLGPMSQAAALGRGDEGYQTGSNNPQAGITWGSSDMLRGQASLLDQMNQAVELAGGGDGQIGIGGGVSSGGFFAPGQASLLDQMNSMNQVFLGRQPGMNPSGWRNRLPQQRPNSLLDKMSQAVELAGDVGEMGQMARDNPLYRAGVAPLRSGLNPEPAQAFPQQMQQAQEPFPTEGTDLAVMNADVNTTPPHFRQALSSNVTTSLNRAVRLPFEEQKMGDITVGAGNSMSLFNLTEGYQTIALRQSTHETPLAPPPPPSAVAAAVAVRQTAERRVEEAAQSLELLQASIAEKAEDAQAPPAERKRGRKRKKPQSASFPVIITEMLEAVEKEGKTDIVSWTPDGMAFTIHKPRRFEEDVMPRFFKTSRLASFHRQLNHYGFRNIKGLLGTFRHQHFRRDKPEEMELIKRASRNVPTGDSNPFDDQVAIENAMRVVQRNRHLLEKKKRQQSK